jgi:hypothetical protein
MREMTMGNLIPVIQAAISPAILMSGIGLLIQSMSVRLGRIIDRTRRMVELRKTGDRTVDAQIRIVWRRARMLRAAITLGAAGALCTATNIILIFLSAVFEINLAAEVLLLFIGGMGCVIVALIIYMLEANQSLKAIGLELEALKG